MFFFAKVGYKIIPCRVSHLQKFKRTLKRMHSFCGRGGGGWKQPELRLMDWAKWFVLLVIFYRLILPWDSSPINHLWWICIIFCSTTLCKSKMNGVSFWEMIIARPRCKSYCQMITAEVQILLSDDHWEGVSNHIHNITLPETNMAPENRPLEKEIPIGNHHFQGLC